MGELGKVVLSALTGMSVAGAIIATLLIVIMALAGVIARMWLEHNKTFKYRLAERDTLIKALNDSTSVLQAMHKATAERNEVTEELSELIMKQGIAFEYMNERFKSQHGIVREDTHRIEMAITAIAEAMRNLVSITENARTELRSFLIRGH